jgi:predicted signal transduction protein with EAL and GGDEF domain/DNA-binding response OmpR family regulator
MTMEALSALHPTASDGDQARVLLVDDDEVKLMLCTSALQTRGFVVTEATRGEHALDLLERLQPDLVVLDALMPGLDGFDTCRALRQRPGFEQVPVLMLTGLDDEASIQRAFDAGATDFFVKSGQWTLLAGRLRYLLRSSRNRIELEHSKTRLARAQDLARMGSLEWRIEQAEPQLSDEARRVLGIAHGERERWRDLLRLAAPVHRVALVRAIQQAMRNETVLLHDVPVCLGPGAAPRTIHIEAEPQFGTTGAVVGYTGIVQDVTERLVARERIQHLANFDPLTDLPNRNQMLQRTERAIEHAQQARHLVALLQINLDRFKVINETLGHMAGDELLKEVSLRLRGCVRHNAAIVDADAKLTGNGAHQSLEAVGRLGGDEFIVLLPEVADADEAELVAQRVLSALETPFLVGGQECFVSASIGIALFPRDALSAADLVRHANVAMSAAKAQGNNAWVSFHPSLAGKGRERLELESALHKAIERNELVLHYQPKVDVRQARMVGVEALMRWQRGGVLVPPGDFIPVAEASGLILAMSEWALREAARQARRWQDSFGFADSIAVNMPVKMFERTDLVDMIHDAVTAAGVPHSAIKIEITETGLMKDLHDVIPTLHRLNAIGVEISIDDFGTGYSSLAYLTTLPISEVKIDRSFVKDLGKQPKSAAVVSAIMALARSLRLRVVAEGVETADQMETLHRLGCGMMQGFLFSKPQPGPLIDEWLQQVVLPKKAPWISAAGALRSDDASHSSTLPQRGEAGVRVA